MKQTFELVFVLQKKWVSTILFLNYGIKNKPLQFGKQTNFQNCALHTFYIKSEAKLDVRAMHGLQKVVD